MLNHVISDGSVGKGVGVGVGAGAGVGAGTWDVNVLGRCYNNKKGSPRQEAWGKKKF
jgi:hypothetical protein